jgi:hypothetical protein
VLRSETAIEVNIRFHDRLLIVDNVELHGLGSSINCLVRRVTSYATRDAKEIAKLLVMVP